MPAVPSIPLPPKGLNIHESRQSQLYAAAITTYLLAVIAIQFVATGLLISSIVWIKQGYGLHLWVLGQTFALDFFKNLFAGEILYTLVICLVKYSILAFYSRLFAKAIRVPVFVLGSIVTAWGIAVLLVSIFQCTPVDGFWNRVKIPPPSPLPKCIVDEYAFFVGIAVPNIVTDAALLALPIPYIWRLHRSQSQKIALAGIFMLGGFVTIISIVRLSTLVSVDLKSLDLDWNFALVGVWTLTESNMAIVSACLPSLKPILSLLVTGTAKPSYGSSQGYSYKKGEFSSSSRSRSRGDTSGGDETDSRHNFVHLAGEPGEYPHERSNSSTVISGGHGEVLQLKSMDYTSKGISVQNEVNLNWQKVQEEK
ncbi:MAG: hypothetical protein LQ351_007332 [Letrouitia transgressa]|nr:MAG: hypothetical protein LQ351_007332 [Letrouitia transgressa]